MADTELTPDLIAFLRDQKDRADILAALHRYTRGVDRHDRELMLSAYWPDAFDEHGVAEDYAAGFVDWAIGWHGEFQTRHQHIINNSSIELDGDTAHVETYYTFWADNRQGPPSLCFGRYLDRFEKRDGRWAIAHRVCVHEWTRTEPAGEPMPIDAARFRQGAEDRDNPGEVSGLAL